VIALTDLQQTEVVTAALMAAGLSQAAVGDKAQRFADAATDLQQRGAAGQGWAFYVPGRIEVLGKHTDYCGGHSIVTAVERGFCVVAAPRNDSVVHVHALDMARSAGLGEQAQAGDPAGGGDEIRFALDPQLEVATGTWTNYPMTVARRLARNFDTCRGGVDIAFSSDLPQASGMSSSSALVIATYLVLATANDLESTVRFGASVTDPLTRAEYLGTLENGQTFGALEGDRGVGTFGGSEDHTAILCSRAGALGHYRYCPTRVIGHIDLPADTVFVVGASGVVAEKTGAAQELYNRASLRVRALVSAWQRSGGQQATYLADIVARGEAAVAQLRLAIEGGSDGFGGDELRTRLDHFLAEEAVLADAAIALTRADLAGFGRLVDRSQQLTHDLLGNQVPQTHDLARLARQAGALAASAFGAGFGGSVWALTSRDEATHLLTTWRQAYTVAHPTCASSSHFFLTGAGPAAFSLAW